MDNWAQVMQKWQVHMTHMKLGLLEVIYGIGWQSTTYLLSLNYTFIMFLTKPLIKKYFVGIGSTGIKKMT